MSEQDIETGIESTRQAILARARAEADAGRIKGVTIFEGQVTDGERVPTDSEGVVKPYIAFVFGGRGQVGIGQRGIASSRNDLTRWTFGVECYSGGPGEVDRLADRVADIYEGFEPPNASEVHSINSGRIENPADVKQNHARTGLGLIFACLTNTISAD